MFFLACACVYFWFVWFPDSKWREAGRSFGTPYHRQKLSLTHCNNQKSHTFKKKPNKKNPKQWRWSPNNKIAIKYYQHESFVSASAQEDKAQRIICVQPFPAEAETELSCVSEMKEAPKGTEGLFFFLQLCTSTLCYSQNLDVGAPEARIWRVLPAQQNWVFAGELAGMERVALGTAQFVDSPISQTK